MLDKVINRIKTICGVGVITVVTLLPGMSASAQSFHCEKDTTMAMEIIRKYYNPGGKSSEHVGEIAELFIGAEYQPLTKLDSLSHLEIRLDAFDDMSFINTVSALAKTSTSPGYLRIRDYADMLEQLTYRRGVDKGFASKMVYAADWVVDNSSRKLVKELTEDYSNQFKTKSLDYVTHHRDEYAALKDSATYEAQKMVEMGFRTHKIPHMRRESTEWKDVSQDLRDGDILMFLTSENDRDVYELGFIRKREDGFHLIHVSETEGKVVEESEPLGRYIKRNVKLMYGYRWIRLM